MIKIRKYRSSDKEQVCAVIENVIREIFNSDPVGLNDISDITKYYNKKGGTLYVATDGKKVVGTIGVYVNDDGLVKIKRMYVYKTYRCKGIGQLLMDKIIDFCKRKQYPGVVLSTYPQMKAAIKFYKKNGFKKYDVAKDKAIRFEKKLSLTR
jgi:ribosomal protein S18 acetylase RimI-like enzyme